MLLEKAKYLEALKERADRIAANALAHYKPYPKQAEFHASGGPLHIRERLLKAGNQVGKTWSAGFEHAMHLTGRYPDWWAGARFDEPTIGWAASETGQTTRDTVQRILLGQVGSWGTGAIPKDALVGDPKRATGGVPDLVETILVKHGGGGDVQAGISRVTIKTYDQGRLRWQGETLDWVWFDEEPPEDIYFEGLTRTNARGGIVTLTFTPLKGMSEVVRRFLQLKPAGSTVTNMTIHDAAHYTPEQRAAIIATYPAHEKEARINGTPTLGSGRIFQLADEVIAEAQISIPAHWPRVCGLDFGWSHPTAAAWLAWDRDSDVVHVYDAYRVSEATPMIHSLAIKARGEWIPVAWPHDGLQHDKGSGEALANQYRKYGVKMLKDKATHPPNKKAGEKEGEGGNGVEAGLMDMLDRMQTGRLKVAKHLNDWFEEFRLYHREDGKIVKEGDDLMCLHPATKVLTRDGAVPIQSLIGRSGEVLSIDGAWAEYRNCRRTRRDADIIRVTYSDGEHLLCTPDHKLLSDDGEWINAIDSTGMIVHNAVSRCEGKQWTKSGSMASGLRGSAGTGEALASSFIVRCGRSITGLFLRGIMSTIRTTTERTTTSAILRPSLDVSTCPSTTADTRGTPQLLLWLSASGAKLQLAAQRCASMARATLTSCAAPWLSWPAHAVASSSLPRPPARTDFALPHARPNSDGAMALTELKRRAQSAKPPSWLTSSNPHSVAPLRAAEGFGLLPKKAAPILKVLRVESAGRSDVFCMEVPGLHAFAIENGAVVHNCATRYGLMMLRHAALPKIEPRRTIAGHRITDRATGVLG